MGREIKESTIKLTEAMAYDVTVAAKRVRINEELLKLPTISMFERHKATLQIARDHETTYVFFTIADDEKEEWVKALLRGKDQVKCTKTQLLELHWFYVKEQQQIMLWRLEWSSWLFAKLLTNGE
ncbi:hypothetical protein F0562_025127 [Nyssa sinensis]|uniref:PH domain-containing protein n=1 Tax=Nyssa sinensis TaxID=561372 RepID=A0A5J5BH87_9ASTE|nr:hypothetical protein F0562_025127 [Nyssa sinensis]